MLVGWFLGPEWRSPGFLGVVWGGWCGPAHLGADLGHVAFGGLGVVLVVADGGAAVAVGVAEGAFVDGLGAVGVFASALFGGPELVGGGAVGVAFVGVGVAGVTHDGPPGRRGGWGQRRWWGCG